MKERIMSISFLAIVTTVALGSGNVLAAWSCRAMDQEACTASASCRWIKGYERSDGRKVAAYCRSLPGGKPEKSASRASSKKV